MTRIYTHTKENALLRSFGGQFRIACLAFAALSLLFFSTGCKKYLDSKSSSRLSTPNSLEDLKAILNNYRILNAGAFLTNNASDEYYLPFNYLPYFAKYFQDSYLWKPDAQPDPNGLSSNDWNKRYNAVFYANTVLDNLSKISSKGIESEWNDIKGQALFFRAFNLFQLAQIYTLAYDSSTASAGLGLPLRLNSDFNESSIRSNLSETFQQLLEDLKSSISLMSNIEPTTKESKTRPTISSAHALLAKIYLYMGRYNEAKSSANSCLQIYGSLLDYNNPIYSTSSNSTPPFELFNDEVIFYSYTDIPLNAFFGGAIVDTVLTSTYDSNDLRKKLFFAPVSGSNRYFYFRGSYNHGLYDLFQGIATDEVYLILAESNARMGNISEAMSSLNYLLHKRWVTGTLTDVTATDQMDALNKILWERRRELVNRGIRWSDIKRLNKDQSYADTLVRNVNGQVYTLPPNDLRFAYLIPQDVINITGMEQNKR